MTNRGTMKRKQIDPAKPMTRKEVKRLRMVNYQAQKAGEEVIRRSELVDVVARNIVEFLKHANVGGEVRSYSRNSLLSSLHHFYSVKTRNTRRHVDHPERILSDALDQLIDSGVVSYRKEFGVYEIVLNEFSEIVHERSWDYFRRQVPHRQQHLLVLEGY